METGLSGDKKLILGEDLPKQNPWQHDRLGYASLAERLARTLINTVTPNGYVIGLHGRWGSGKSTMLNFVLAHIAKHNEENQEDQIIHIDFRPWLIAGHQDLIVGFFKILTENLTANDPTWKRNKRKIANVFGATSNELIDAAAKIALTLDPSGGFASGAVGKIAKSGIGAMLKPFLDDPSVQSAYITLIDRLKNSNKRFLVTIDDIDRLNDDEIKSIMHMVKSVGQLPNVTYSMSEKPDANLYDLEKLHEASETHMNSSSLSNDQCNLIKAIFEGTSRFLNRHDPTNDEF